MNIDASIFHKLQHYLQSGELMLFTHLEMYALEMDPKLKGFVERSGTPLELLRARSAEALGPNWFDESISGKDWCIKCSRKNSVDNMVFCNSGKHSLCASCSVVDEYNEDTGNFRKTYCHCGERLIN